MDAQLHLIPTSELVGPDDPAAEAGRADWRLDPSTKAVGLRGVEQARAALRTAVRHRHLGPDDHRASAA
jgi:hypothetical protein